MRSCPLTAGRAAGEGAPPGPRWGGCAGHFHPRPGIWQGVCVWGVGSGVSQVGRIGRGDGGGQAEGQAEEQKHTARAGSRRAGRGGRRGGSCRRLTEQVDLREDQSITGRGVKLLAAGKGRPPWGRGYYSHPPSQKSNWRHREGERLAQGCRGASVGSSETRRSGYGRCALKRGHTGPLGL